MISFLVRTDRYGILEEIFWSDPVDLITESQQSLFTIFAEDQRESIKEEFQIALLSSYTTCSDNNHRLARSNSPIYCSMVCSQEQVLVYGSNDLQTAHIIKRFMKVVIEMSVQSGFGSIGTTNHFEQIQMLNNELMNTHRKLQKANAQLKRVNDDLNNRLVKDTLTSLVSRYQYRSEMEHTIAQNPEGIGLFCFIDIDNFKMVNDRYGHAVGDEYLIEFARRLQAIPTDRPTIHIRIAGDEFGLYMHNIDKDIHQVCTRLWNNFKSAVIARPIHTKAGDLPINCSLGAAYFGKDTNDIYTLIEYADFAMYQAKRSGKSTYRIFDLDEYIRSKRLDTPGSTDIRDK